MEGNFEKNFGQSPFFKFNDHSYHFKYPDFLYSLLDIGILDKNVQKPTQLLLKWKPTRLLTPLGKIKTSQLDFGLNLYSNGSWFLKWNTWFTGIADLTWNKRRVLSTKSDFQVAEIKSPIWALVRLDFQRARPPDGVQILNHFKIRTQRYFSRSSKNSEISTQNFWFVVIGILA